MYQINVDANKNIHFQAILEHKLWKLKKTNHAVPNACSEMFVFVVRPAPPPTVHIYPSNVIRG